MKELRAYYGTLTSDQERAVSMLTEFLESDYNCFILNGYAGTGKTFLVKGLVQFLRDHKRMGCLMAPTGRAAMVMSDRTGMQASTIHRVVFNMDDIEDDEESFKFRLGIRRNNVADGVLYIVDESSMISDDYNDDEFFQFGTGHLLTDMMTYWRFDYLKDCKVIFLGDQAQLQFSDRELPPALDPEILRKQFGLKVMHCEMSQVQRQDNQSGILSLATSIRGALSGSQFHNLVFPRTEDIDLVQVGDLVDLLSAHRGEDGMETVVITHTNSGAKDFNDMIRDVLYPGQVDLQAGEIVICTRNNYNYAHEIYNGQFLVLKSSSDEFEHRNVAFRVRGGDLAKVDLTFRQVVVRFQTIGRVWVEMPCKILENILHSSLARLAPTEQQALYVDFKMRNPNLRPRTAEFKDALKNDPYFNALQVKFGYAITCHKAQGGEWGHVFLDCAAKMGKSTRGYYRWLYTGVTRASKVLHALNVYERTSYSELRVQPIQKVERIPPGQFRDNPNNLNQETEEEFSFPFLKNLFLTLKDKFKDSGVVIGLRHNQYFERYTFRRDGKEATIDFYYGNHGLSEKINVLMSNDEAFKQFVLEKVNSPVIHDFEYRPGNSYQADMFSYVRELCDEFGIAISNIVPEQNLDRYFLMTNAKAAYLDCWYNGKGMYTYIKPASTGGEGDLKLKQLTDFMRDGIK